MKNFQNKTFPWPVLRDEVDDYVYGEFRCKIDLSITEDASVVRLTADFVVQDNNDLSNLLKQQQGKVQYCVIVSNSRTFYREAFYAQNRKLLQYFEDGILSDKVIISPFIVAHGCIKGYTNSAFHEEYDQASFDLENGSVLALGKPQVYFVDTTLFKQLGSVFRLDSKSISDGSFEYKIGDTEFITIYMSSKDCSRFEMIRKKQDVVAIKKFFAGVYLPVLTAVLYDLDRDYGEYKELRWARALESRLNEFGLKPPEKGDDRLADAQLILESPFRGILDLED